MKTTKIHMSRSKPLVSVIMPVYNAGNFLVRAIESIRSQTVKDIEFLIIDDGSTDGSWDIIKRYAKRDSRIRKFHNKKNLGLVKSLNSIIPKTRGIYVARMDADDISLPERFEKQITYLESHPTLVACGGQEHIIDTHGRIIAEKFFPTDEKICYDMQANMMVIQPPLLMAHGKVFRTLRYDNHLFRNDDISIHFKLLEKGGFGNVDEIIFKYRKRNESLTHSNPKKVYFLALLVRINAMRKYQYTPAIWNLFMAILETIVVAILPNRGIVWGFEMLRHTKYYRARMVKKLQYMFQPA